MITNVSFGKSVVIEEGAIINIREGSIGDRSIIRAGARIEGNKVIIGKESYLDYGAWIGGGSCWGKEAFLEAGDWLHMGWNSHINIARGVTIGDEVGIGVGTQIFTHGSYPPLDKGFPVQWAGVEIGSRVWLPNAWVNPGVEIGDNVVVAAGSLVNTDLPAGCLAAGVPAKVVRENEYPKEIKANILRDKIENLLCEIDEPYIVKVHNGEVLLCCGDTMFNITKRTILGKKTSLSKQVKNQLRRNGIRFQYTEFNGEYKPW